jgi:hypothetical protein
LKTKRCFHFSKELLIQKFKSFWTKEKKLLTLSKLKLNCFSFVFTTGKTLFFFFTMSQKKLKNFFVVASWQKT